jgi:hypothetical protein
VEKEKDRVFWANKEGEGSSPHLLLPVRSGMLEPQEMRTERRAKRGWRAGLFALRPMVGRSDLDIDFLRWAVSRTRRGLRVICMNGSRRAETCRWACPSGERGYARSMRTGHFSMTCVDALIWGSGLHGGAHVAVRSAGNRSYASWEGGEQAARHGKKLGDRFAVILQMEQKAENEAVRARGPRGFRDPPHSSFQECVR